MLYVSLYLLQSWNETSLNNLFFTKCLSTILSVASRSSGPSFLGSSSFIRSHVLNIPWLSQKRLTALEPLSGGALILLNDTWFKDLEIPLYCSNRT
ncbi:hypothetical protein OTU49_005298 [Cherax quadricarinatus]|uniref:Uncharacterized protein n=1 Tax=Cherax quadricarinatus TaxID=27406 RepID=A0AAW0YLE4_CHEQU